MRISIAQKKDLISIFSSDLDIRVVERIKEDDIVGKRFYGIMYAVRRAFALCRQSLEELQPEDTVVFEITNNTFVLWMERGESNKEYEKYFEELLNELDMLPIRYKFIYSKDSSAMRFMDEYDGKVKLSGMEDLFNA